MEQENPGAPPEGRKAPRRNPFEGLIPTKDYFFTPIIININLLFFIGTLLSGAGLISPSPDIIVEWGANLRSYTVGKGEWWRLIAAMFLHYGIIHLAVNMFSLYNLGRLLEPFIGKWRFLGLYFATGIAASVVSVWWHDSAAAAGASGAIMGIVGVLTAILTTDLIDKSIRTSLLKSLGTSILLTIAIGFSGFVDNAGHMGGLVAGALGGYLIYFELRSFYLRRKQQYTFTLLSIALIGGICAVLWMRIPASQDVEGQLARFDEENNIALDAYEDYGKLSPEQVRVNMVERWSRCESIADSLGTSKDLNSGPRRKLLRNMKNYSTNRRIGAEYIYRGLTENRPDFLKDSAGVYMKKAEDLMPQLFGKKEKGK